MFCSGQRRIRHALAEYGFVVMCFLWAVYLTLATENFATTDNIFTSLRQAAIIGITAIGAHFVILMGDMDLSAAAVISLSGVVMGEAMVNQGFAPIPAALAALVVGALVGLANGLIVTQLRINAIITTLGTSSILSGIAFTITQGKTIYGERGNDPIDKIEFLSRNRVLGDWVPVPVIILFACYIIAFIVLGVLVLAGSFVYLKYRETFAITSPRDSQESA